MPKQIMTKSIMRKVLCWNILCVMIVMTNDFMPNYIMPTIFMQRDREPYLLYIFTHQPALGPSGELWPVLLVCNP
jgi:hypothetical protein